MAVLGFTGVAVLMVAVLMCYVQINAISTRIVDMKKEISALEVDQVALQAKYEQAFDLTRVKEEAQSYGMSQPSESQVYYIALPGQDQVVAYGGQEEGLLSSVLSFLSQRFYAVVEYFR